MGMSYENIAFSIVADDYRFSMKIGENNIEFGKAGDCYSQMNCPQGRFAINLSGTMLMLSPEVHWPKQKNAYAIINKIVRASNKILLSIDLH
jgi:hypothetical protein